MKQAGVNRSHTPSIPQKLVFFILHLLIVTTCAWLLYFKGLETLGNWFDKQWYFNDSTRASILFACVVVYWLRHTVTLFYILARNIDYSEVFGLIVFFALFEVGLLLLGGGVFRDYTIKLGWLDSIALILLLIGSFFNSFSEIQRKSWKQNKGNNGHCYTKGLFSYSVHINYFGDVLLFSGWVLFTYNLWTLLLPALILISFILFHIPALDTYLENHYGQEFISYSEHTKKIIPFIY
jgi:protein-S-isoprenylcysteine O-methyltransferase Ste14